MFGPLATQEEVFGGTCGGMVRDSIYRGFNGTILAYGQTGSGEFQEDESCVKFNVSLL